LLAGIRLKGNEALRTEGTASLNLAIEAEEQLTGKASPSIRWRKAKLDALDAADEQAFAYYVIKACI
jgi:hypothetical protein